MQHPLSTPELRSIVEACHHRMGRPLSAHELDDVVQEVEVVALGSAQRYAGRAKFETWIYGVARFEVLRQQRARSRRRTDELPEGLCVTDQGTQSAAATHTREQVRRRLREFGSTVAEIVMARDGLDQSFQAVAERLNMSLVAVRARYYRSLPRLRERLGPVWRRLQGE